MFNPNLINTASKKFGSQSIVVSVDVKKIKNNYFVFVENGKTNTKIEISEHIKNINENNCHDLIEIFTFLFKKNSINHNKLFENAKSLIIFEENKFDLFIGILFNVTKKTLLPIINFLLRSIMNTIDKFLDFITQQKELKKKTN